MTLWRVELCEEEAGWYWECRDNLGNFLCRCPRRYKRCWQALKDFELGFDDFWAMMRARFA